MIFRVFILGRGRTIRQGFIEAENAEQIKNAASKKFVNCGVQCKPIFPITVEEFETGTKELKSTVSGGPRL